MKSMARKRARRRAPARNGNGLELHAAAFTEAYRDASYGIMLRMVEDLLNDPEERRAIEEVTLRLYRGIVRKLEERLYGRETKSSPGASNQ